MPLFQSIVVLDLETSGLPAYNQNSAKITELSAIGCEVNHIENSIPRVLHKLVLCFNPRRKIALGSTHCSGLDNDLLENVAPFDIFAVESLKSLIARLPQPVCLVAHNGNRFDFPILKKEIITCGGELSMDLFCADSLPAFRELYPKNPKLSMCLSRPISCSPSIKNDEDDEICLRAVDAVDYTTPKKQRLTIQELNETTPTSKKTPIYNGNASNARRVLNYCDESPTNSLNDSLPYPKSYKLCDIYHFFHRRDFSDAHRAENDCMALLCCIIKSKDVFVDWMNRNALSFDAISPAP